MNAHAASPAGSETNAPLIEMEELAVSSLGDVNSVVAEGICWTVRAGDYWVVAGLQGHYC